MSFQKWNFINLMLLFFFVFCFFIYFICFIAVANIKLHDKVKKCQMCLNLKTIYLIIFRPEWFIDTHEKVATLCTKNVDQEKTEPANKSSIWDHR